MASVEDEEILNEENRENEFKRENCKVHQIKTDRNFCSNHIELDLNLNGEQLKKILDEELFKNCQIFIQIHQTEISILILVTQTKVILSKSIH